MATSFKRSIVDLAHIRCRRRASLMRIRRSYLWHLISTHYKRVSPPFRNFTHNIIICHTSMLCRAGAATNTAVEQLKNKTQQELPRASKAHIKFVLQKNGIRN